MKILIVGAGATGQVYGRHLQLGGAEISYLVRPKYAEECRRGFSLYPLNRRSPRGAPVHFKAEILTTGDEVAARTWNQIHLCVSSTALRGPWLDELLKMSGDATVVMLQPAFGDREYLLARLSAERLVTGMISMVSYHAPLPGERVPEPGMAYWLPPLSPSLYSGPRAATVADALKAGELPAKTTADVAKASAFPGALLQMLIAALEESDWSFDKLVHSDRLRVASDASREACAMLEKKLETRTPFGVRAFSPFMLRASLPAVKRLVPLDLETYLRTHFTKVGDQTRFMLRGYIDHAKQLKLPTHQMEALLRKLPD